MLSKASAQMFLRYSVIHSPEELFECSFTKTLADQSIAYWQLVTEDAATDVNYHVTIQLIFITRNKKLVPSFCTISRLLYSDKIIISTVTTILQDALSDIPGNFKNIPPRISDAVLIQDVHDYILKHLEEPLPTVKELSKIFGTNEFRLKDGFRHFFNTSIYQFYIEEKLKRAHLLIQQTDIPLKAIALMCGFNDYTNFYKSFKKRFNYSPSDLLRGDGDGS
ncbi:MAG TPA: AraC family transcriptional regulator [Pedobacter sp.]|uniref:helix-turn-helix domain-containing protein n=1 Tax=Pedobacter sp. TaxID=1411316 RepID=UPI002C03B1AE|nr:AraC family transcriptional regulator [Pedobacter sp.]HMI02126.1 AraC family transcriptional regulator [Pedobacter sp.]